MKQDLVFDKNKIYIALVGLTKKKKTKKDTN